MTSETRDSSGMVDLAMPARLYPVMVMSVCAPFIGGLLWLIWVVVPEAEAGLDLPALALLFTWSCFLIFPFTRSLQTLFLRPHFRTDGKDINIRHWGGVWWLFLPFHWIRNDRLRWTQIRGVVRKCMRIKQMVVADCAVIECEGRDPVHIHRGVFNLSVNAIVNMIRNRIAVNESKQVLPPEQSYPYVRRLHEHFATTRVLRYSPRLLRLVGLIVGPPVGFFGWRWVFVHIGEVPSLDWVMAIASCGGIGWLIYATDEAVRCVRYHGRNFWFRRDGLVVGPDEFFSEVRPWREIVGARRRVRQTINEHNVPQRPTLDGVDILLRDGGAVWIPELYSDKLDELCEVLSPNDAERVECAE